MSTNLSFGITLSAIDPGSTMTTFGMVDKHIASIGQTIEQN
jgi:hypothetical protein